MPSCGGAFSEVKLALCAGLHVVSVVLCISTPMLFGVVATPCQYGMALISTGVTYPYTVVSVLTRETHRS